MASLSGVHFGLPVAGRRSGLHVLEAPDCNDSTGCGVLIITHEFYVPRQCFFALSRQDTGATVPPRGSAMALQIAEEPLD